MSITDTFELDSRPVSCRSHGSGHINSTFLVTTESGRRYILQKINTDTFKCVDALMDNIVRVTSYIHGISDDPRAALTPIPTSDGRYYCRDDEGTWRMYDYIENSLCLQSPRTDADFYQSAVGFGGFEQQMAEFDAETLHETIPDFHNTPKRYETFKEILRKDPLGRAAEVQREIEFILDREEEMAVLQKLLDRGDLPVRVTHNDTKLNNVLLDRETGRALCVIDLDTVMPGLSLYDFGDSIRFGASTAAEDERDLSKVSMSLERYRVFTEGFVTSCPALTREELELLPLGAKTMTLECGMRFLADYIDGDHYYAIHRPEQNLDRARTQIRLVGDMEQKWDAMRRSVSGCTSRLKTLQ